MRGSKSIRPVDQIRSNLMIRLWSEGIQLKIANADEEQIQNFAFISETLFLAVQ